MKRSLIYFANLVILILTTACVGQKEEIIDNNHPSDSPITGGNESNPNENGEFLKRSIILDFTATWCVNCPAMAAAIESVSNELPDRIIDISVHMLDDYASSVGDKIISEYDITAIPVAIVDLDAATATSVASSTILLNSVNQKMNSIKPASGIKITSSAEDGTLTVDIECKIKSENRYKLAVALLRDGVIASQTGGAQNYVHNSILFAHLQKDYPGEDLGKLYENDAITKRYECPLSKIDALNNTRIVAYLLQEQNNGKYIVNNATVCKAGSSVDYVYEPQ